jgi:two-component system cell cycle response regulator
MNERNSILIVDDDISLLGIFKTALLAEGYRCETAAIVERALEFINKIPFDVMITDIKMPGLTGFELTEKAKKIRPDMSVIIMTAYIEEFSYDNAIEAGASDFIKKPFTVKELLARIQHVKLQEKIRAMSVTDELTGLYNRRGFFTLAERELKIANRDKRKIFFIYVDLDNLKEINDTFGHLEGDMVLIETAKILKETFRQSDIIARIGGDEFIAVLIGTTEAYAETIISRLRKNIDILNEKINHSYKFSISTGIACYNPEFPSSIVELLHRADKSMYEQKRYKQLF